MNGAWLWWDQRNKSKWIKGSGRTDELSDCGGVLEHNLRRTSISFQLVACTDPYNDIRDLSQGGILFFIPTTE